MRNVLNIIIVMVCCFSILSCNTKTGKGATFFKRLQNGGEVNGPRTVENVEKNIGILMPRLQHYYNKRLKTNPELQGMIQVILDVDYKGTILYVNIGKATTKDPEFEEQILIAISNHSFDEWEGVKEKTEVIYPLTFVSEKKSEEAKAPEEAEAPEEEKDIEKPKETEEVKETETEEEKEAEEVEDIEEETE